ncbi:hypothetical protein F383_32123 [Gossypium arboreum]|jgi:hypothetical protein
MYRLV